MPGSTVRRPLPCGSYRHHEWSAADVILPSTSWGEHEGVFTAADRGFQRFFKAVEPKWDLKTDWQIISEIATRMGYPMHYNNTQEIWDELRHLCPDFYGATYEKMGELGDFIAIILFIHQACAKLRPGR